MISKTPWSEERREACPDEVTMKGVVHGDTIHLVKGILVKFVYLLHGDTRPVPYQLLFCCYDNYSKNSLRKKGLFGVTVAEG